MLLRSNQRFIWLFIVMLAIICGLLGSGMQWSIWSLRRCTYMSSLNLNDQSSSLLMPSSYPVHEHIITYGNTYWTQYGLWLVYIMALAAVSMAAIRINPAAQGSGVPEMKSILSGVQLNNFLAGNIFVAKLISVIAACGSGIFTPQRCISQCLIQ